jgi:hypothetical protein
MLGAVASYAKRARQKKDALRQQKPLDRPYRRLKFTNLLARE